MKVSRFEPRNCWRVQVPARWSDDRKPHAEYFKTREEGNARIAKLFNRPASSHSVRMPMGDQVKLETWRAEMGSDQMIQQALDHYRKTVLSVQKQGTVFQMVAEYRAWQATQNRTQSGVATLKYWSHKFEATFGPKQVTELTYSDLSGWINGFPGGKGHAGRRNSYTYLHALLNWAQKNGWLGQDILKGMDKPERNILKNVMAVAHFEMILRACAASDEFRSILPTLILQGLAGVRTCELIGKLSNQPDILYWSDINWPRGWVTVRDEVAKQTGRKAGDQRFVILCPAGLEWLKLSAQKSGPIFAGSRAVFDRIKNQMLKSVGLKMAQNTLRHSYATYGASIGSIAEVAKNMGDTESRVIATYLDRDIEPETGLAWFALRPAGPGKVVPMKGSGSMMPQAARGIGSEPKVRQVDAAPKPPGAFSFPGIEPLP
jgi:hypothetical protein